MVNQFKMSENYGMVQLRRLSRVSTLMALTAAIVGKTVSIY